MNSYNQNEVERDNEKRVLANVKWRKIKMSDMNMMTKGEHYSKIEIPSIRVPNKLLSAERVHAHACSTQYMRHG